MSEKQKHCYIESCAANQEVTFNWREKSILIGKNHRVNHCELEKKFKTEIPGELREAAIKQISKLKSEIKYYKSKIIQEELSLITDIQNITKKTLKSLKIQETKLNACIFKTWSLNEIESSKEDTFFESWLKLALKDFPKISDIKFLELHVNHIKSDDIQQLFELEDLTEENNCIDKFDCIMKYIWNSCSTALSTFNIKTLKEEEICLPHTDDEGLDQYGANCLLPDGSLFYTLRHVTIIIDPQYCIKQLPSYSPLSLYACAVYKDEEIYLLGGHYNTSAKFSLTNKRWTPLINLLIDLGSYTFGAIFKNYIILVSIDSKRVIYYDTSIDSYSQISSVKLGKASKAVFVDNDTVYIIEFSQYIYRSTDHLATWDNIGSSQILIGNAPVISKPISYKKAAYFATYYGIYLFDFRTKYIKKLKSLAKY